MDSEAARGKPIKTKKDYRGSIVFCSAIAGFIVLGVCAVGLGVAKLVLGVIYIKDCELKPLLPVYLIVDFCAWLLVFLSVVIVAHRTSREESKAAAKKEEKPQTKPCGLISTLSCLLLVLIPVFIFCWFIVGTVWVVDVRNQISSPGHCQNTTRSPPFTQPSTDNFPHTTGTLDPASTATYTSTPFNLATTQPAVTTTSGHEAQCVTCDKALVTFTFVVAVVQWALVGAIVAAGIVILSIFGLILCLCKAIN